jgi:hypothetical protein
MEAEGASSFLKVASLLGACQRRSTRTCPSIPHRICNPNVSRIRIRAYEPSAQWAGDIGLDFSHETSWLNGTGHMQIFSRIRPCGTVLVKAFGPYGIILLNNLRLGIGHARPA